MAGKLPKRSIRLILCEDAVTDPDRRTMDLLRTFVEIAADHFPWSMPQVCVYLEIDDPRDGDDFGVMLLSPDRESHGPLWVRDDNARHTMARLVVAFRPAVFDRPGIYTAMVLLGGVVIYSREFLVLGPEELRAGREGRWR